MSALDPLARNSYTETLKPRHGENIMAAAIPENCKDRQ